MRSPISLRSIFRVRDIHLFCLQRMPIHRISDAGIAVSILLLKLRANFWIKVRVHQLVRIGLSSFRGERICLHSLQKEKVSRIAKKVRRNEENHVYRCSRLQEWRLAPMLIKTNLVRNGGKKQNKKPVMPRNLAADRKERCLLRLRDYRSLTTIRGAALRICAAWPLNTNRICGLPIVSSSPSQRSCIAIIPPRSPTCDAL